MVAVKLGILRIRKNAHFVVDEGVGKISWLEKIAKLNAQADIKRLRLFIRNFIEPASVVIAASLPARMNIRSDGRRTLVLRMVQEHLYPSHLPTSVRVHICLIYYLCCVS
jgi:hypothetical protein